MLGKLYKSLHRFYGYLSQREDKVRPRGEHAIHPRSREARERRHEEAWEQWQQEMQDHDTDDSR